MLAVWIVTAVVSGALGSVPLIGIILSNIAGLFLEMWSSMMPAVFYYEYGRIRA